MAIRIMVVSYAGAGAVAVLSRGIVKCVEPYAFMGLRKGRAGKIVRKHKERESRETEVGGFYRIVLHLNHRRYGSWENSRRYLAHTW